ncbi:MAG: MarR family winged helix-turn-helix transcriptional regulator [Solirubrobacterales bacterium]
MVTDSAGQAVPNPGDDVCAAQPIFSEQTLPHAKRSVGFMLSKLGMVVSNQFHQSLARIGVDPGQCHLMLLINQREGQSQQALAEELSIPKSRMVALVDDLERRGFAERRQNPEDRRQHALYLTESGRKIYGEAMKIAAEHERRVCSTLTAAQRETMLALLAKMVEADTSGLPADVHPGLAGTRAPGETARSNRPPK